MGEKSNGIIFKSYVSLSLSLSCASLVRGGTTLTRYTDFALTRIEKRFVGVSLTRKGKSVKRVYRYLCVHVRFFLTIVGSYTIRNVRRRTVLEYKRDLYFHSFLLSTEARKDKGFTEQTVFYFHRVRLCILIASFYLDGKPKRRTIDAIAF